MSGLLVFIFLALVCIYYQHQRHHAERMAESQKLRTEIIAAITGKDV